MDLGVDPMAALEKSTGNGFVKAAEKNVLSGTEKAPEVVIANADEIDLGEDE